MTPPPIKKPRPKPPPPGPIGVPRFQADDATANKLGIQPQPPRQDSLEDQLRDVHIIAARVGCYDAADWIWKNGLGYR